MSAEKKKILDLAGRLSDGAPVDWESADHLASSAEQRVAIQGLRILARISDVHRGEGPAPEASGKEKTMSLLEDEDDDEHKIVPFRPSTDGSPARWGHLEILSRLGEGAFGEVYRARDANLDREVALKLLRSMPDSAERASVVVREGRLMAKVRHPNIVSVYGAEKHDGRVGLWMEFVEGRTLDEQLRDSGTFGAREASLIGIDLCRALSTVHGAGLVHRDVKAQNVMRAAGGRTVLMDFGAGWDTTEARPDSAQISGTPLYMAPEVLSGEGATTRSDIYSLGVLLYHLVSGGFPVSGSSLPELYDHHRRQVATLLRDARSDLPEAFVQVVERALARDPQQRFVTTGEMEQALSAALGAAPAAAIEGRAGKRAPRRLGAALVGAAFFAVLVAALAAGLLARRDGRSPDPAGAAPAYTVEASLFRLDANGVRRRLESGSRLALGDRLTLEMNLSRQAYVYVINEDDQGRAHALFPVPGLDLNNPLPAGAKHVLPGSLGGKDFSWQVDSYGGRERMLIVASPQRLLEFEAEMNSLAKPQPGAAAVPLPERALIRLRGLGRLAEIPADPGGERAGKLFALAEALSSKPESVQGVWVRQLELENPGR